MSKSKFKWSTALFFLLVVCSSLQLCISVQEFEVQPYDVTAKRGDPVYLPCVIKNQKGTLQWTRDGLGLGVDRQLVSYPRYRMLGTNETGKKTYLL